MHLEKKFEVDDDVAMENLARCLEELKKSKLDYAGPPPPHELPSRAFGMFKEPTFEQKVNVSVIFFVDVNMKDISLLVILFSLLLMIFFVVRFPIYSSFLVKNLTSFVLGFCAL